MDQERIGKIIRKIRKENHLTQKQLADKYGVTYQAVSKWENGKNIPDISLLKQISKDFNIPLEQLLDGKLEASTSKYFLKIGILFIIIILLCFLCLFLLNLSEEKDFKFKTLKTSCKQFNISGSIAYNRNKSSIYISNITYCGGEDENNYQEIECILYEENENTQIKISEWNYKKENAITLEKFLKNLEFNIDNYSSTCKEFSHNSLYLQINATDKDGKITSYKIPLSLEKNCSD